MPQAQLAVNAITLASIYILISIGLTTIYGVLKILHIAHGAVYVFGAYFSIVIFAHVDNLVITILVASLASGILGVLILLLVYRRLLTASRLTALVASIGVYYLAYDSYFKTFGPNPIGFPGITSPVSTQSIIPSISLSGFQFAIIVVAILSVLGMWFFLTKTKLGLGMRAVALDKDMASALGMNAGMIIILAFFIGSFLAGLGGSMVAIYSNQSYYTQGDTVIAVGLAVIVLGGLGSVSGTVIGAIIVASVQTLLDAYSPAFVPPFTVAFILLVAILVIRPSGLRGKF